MFGATLKINSLAPNLTISSSGYYIPKPNGIIPSTALPPPILHLLKPLFLSVEKKII